MGRKIAEVLPGLDIILSNWIDLGYGVTVSSEYNYLEFYHQESERWYELTIYGVQPGYYAVQFHDISGRKRAEEKMRNYCFHNQLTGLYNRRFLEEEMDRLDSERLYPISVIMADLNGLKLVNHRFSRSLI